MSESPLVSILIPTYNRGELFSVALTSALNQTYRNVEIVVSDDSSNDSVERALERHNVSNGKVLYYRNDPPLGAAENFRKCMELANGRYINFLMDDDVFGPTKIEKMVECILSSRGISFVTSRRATIDERGKATGEALGFEQFFQESTVIDGAVVCKLCLSYLTNFIGEPTTVLFDRECLTEPFGILHGREYGCNVDMAAWGGLWRLGRLGFINEYLSAFRIHEGQQSNLSKMLMYGLADWIHQIKCAELDGLFESRDDKKRAAQRLCVVMNNVLNTSEFGNCPEESRETDLFALFSEFWENFIR